MSNQATTGNGLSLTERYIQSKKRKWGFFLLLIPLLILVALVSVATGSAGLSFSDVITSIFGNAETVSETAYLVVWQIRLPRILMAVLVGIGLGASGGIMQGVLRNPLADSYMLGISSAAALGASLAIIYGHGILGGQFLTVGNAFVFAVACTLIIVGISSRKGARPAVIVLIGVTMNLLFQAANTLLLYAADSDAAKTAMFWAVGDLGRGTWDNIALITGLIVICLPVLLYKSRDLNILNMGDEAATSMGIRVQRLRITLMLVSALMVAGIVSFSGIIGFVGLVAPHICRIIIGGDNKILIPSAALMSAVLLMLSDLLARTVLSPVTLPVGIVTAFLGVPLLIYLIMRKKGEVW